jgi:5-formyltetrahydrofolate cyclo-ligase
MSLPDAKSDARLALKARRAAIPAEDRTALSSRMANVDCAAHLPPPPAIVSGFLPIRDEIDPRPLMAMLRGLGYRLCLPVMQGPGKPLLFRAYAPGAPLASAAWNIPEPLADAALVDPDVLLVPLLAFDAAGNRLGYGAGYYDRTIAGLKRHKRVTTIGLAFDQQRIDAVPHLAYDEPLDWVLTPSGLIDCRQVRGRPTGA